MLSGCLSRAAQDFRPADRCRYVGSLRRVGYNWACHVSNVEVCFQVLRQC